MPEHVNIAERLRRNARNTPDKNAVVICRGPNSPEGTLSHESMTFSELDALSGVVAAGCLDAGVKRGTKTLVMLRPSFQFFACIFGLFRIGAVPVVIDPGMGKKRLLECIRDTAPEAMIAVPLAHAVRVMFPGYFPSLKINITAGRRWFWGGHSWKKLLRNRKGLDTPAETEAGDLAAILFTTGSTGPAKGVEYDHAALDRQVDIIAEAFSITSEDVDCATFPGFSLFSVALGMTAVVPDMNPTRPGLVNPANIVAPIDRLKCTFSFGSPALWSRVSRHCADNGVVLRSLKRVVMAGAPVRPEVHERLLGGVIALDGKTFTPYGATEVMPVANIEGAEVLAGTAAVTARGGGTCVGRPVPGARVEIIPITDSPIRSWSEGLALPPGSIGEIAVKASHASRRYHNRPDADDFAKIRDEDAFWHRMGDLGYKDGLGRIWLCGRKSHRVVTRQGPLFTLRCEAVFNQHPAVARCALVGIPAADGTDLPVVVAELKERSAGGKDLEKELLALAAANSETAQIRHVLFHPALPTDIRHNAKIGREELAVWARRKLLRVH